MKRLSSNDFTQYTQLIENAHHVTVLNIFELLGSITPLPGCEVSCPFMSNACRLLTGK